jgi:hypothetical protein
VPQMIKSVPDSMAQHMLSAGVAVLRRLVTQTPNESMHYLGSCYKKIVIALRSEHSMVSRDMW